MVQVQLIFIGNVYSSTICKFQECFDNTLNPKTGPNGEPIISKSKSQVGKYADIDGDGTVDGIIFADLMIGGNGVWNSYDSSNSSYNLKGKYSISKITSSKDYYVSQKSYTNKLGGSAEVLTPVGTSNDRFYIVSLNNLFGTYDWYNSANGNMKDYTTTTSEKFGKGKDNTSSMISKWENKAYGEQDNCTNHKDIWGQIKNQSEIGWFIPSREEWAAFANQLEITKSNYISKGLSGWYWASSQSNSNNAHYITFDYGHITNDFVNYDAYVRLATSF